MNSMGEYDLCIDASCTDFPSKEYYCLGYTQFFIVKYIHESKQNHAQA